MQVLYVALALLLGSACLNATELADDLQELDKLNQIMSAELAQNGFVVVDDGEVANWVAVLSRSEAHLLKKSEVTDRLVFAPTSLQDFEALTYIGSEAIGSITNGRSDSVVSVYRSNFGIVTVSEVDLTNYTDEFNQSQPSYFETVNVGDQQVLVFVIRGQRSGIFETQLLWEERGINREYSISVNLNLNDANHLDEREVLFEVVHQISSL